MTSAGVALPPSFARNGAISMPDAVLPFYQIELRMPAKGHVIYRMVGKQMPQKQREARRESQNCEVFYRLSINALG
jgi:hypothetical protein